MVKQSECAVLLLKVADQPKAKFYRCPAVSVDQIIEAAQRDDNTGICVNCGAEQGNCEPDARGYRCESCGMRGVFGAEELLARLSNA